MKFIKFLLCFSIITSLFYLTVFGETKENNVNEWVERSLPLTISEENDETYILTNKITGEEITDVYETVNGITKKLNVEEALDRLNKLQKSELNENLNDNNIENYEAGFVQNYFKKISVPNKVTGTPEKISYDIKGPASIQISQAQQVTFSESFSADVTYSMKSTIRLGAGVQWAKSTTRSVAVTHQVPSGKIGYVEFKPYYYEVIGDYITEIPRVIIDSKRVSARTPITLSNGLCDGLEYVVLK